LLCACVGSCRYVAAVPNGLFVQAAESAAAIAQSNQALQTEIAERRLTEAALHQREQLVRAQAAALLEVSTILLPISDEAMVVPLIGTLDAERARRLTEVLLAGVNSNRVQVVILDITGMQMVDAQAANALVNVARAVRLLGAETVITGIRAEVARVLVNLGVDLSGIVTRSSLQSGIAYALGETTRLAQPEKWSYIPKT